MANEAEPDQSNPLGPIDASGQPLGGEQIIPPEQPPMEDAAGGPQADKSETLEETPTEDLEVQGGE